MTITHREGWMPNFVTQSNYPSLGNIYFLGWIGDPMPGDDLVAVFRIKYKVAWMPSLKTQSI